MRENLISLKYDQMYGHQVLNETSEDPNDPNNKIKVINISKFKSQV